MYRRRRPFNNPRSRVNGYPMGFYHRGVEGRIDDPKAGWKGRGLWANYGSYNPWHYEGGKGTTSKAVHFQLRPNPLAK